MRLACAVLQYINRDATKHTHQLSHCCCNMACPVSPPCMRCLPSLPSNSPRSALGCATAVLVPLLCRCLSYASVQQVHLYDAAGHLKGCHELLQDSISQLAQQEGRSIELKVSTVSGTAVWVSGPGHFGQVLKCYLWPLASDTSGGADGLRSSSVLLDGWGVAPWGGCTLWPSGQSGSSSQLAQRRAHALTSEVINVT
jgi:hypothetical protein